MEYRGTIKKVIGQKEDWASVLITLEKGGSIKAAGIIPGASEGQKLVLDGEVKIHPIYGEQVTIKSCKTEVAHGTSGIVAYLSSGLIKGVGDSLAKRIVQMFGENTLAVIEKEPQKLKAVSGISDKKLDNIVQSHAKNNTFSLLYDRLGGKITPHQAAKIIDKYGSNSLKVIEKNPYSLIYTIDGFGFKKADGIAKATGLAYDDPARVGAAVVYVLKQLSESDGHCYGTSDIVQIRTLDLLVDAPKFLETRQINDLIKKADDWNDIKNTYCKTKKLTDEHQMEITSWLDKRNAMLEKLADAIVSEAEAGRLVIDGADIYHAKIHEAETQSAKLIAEMTTKKTVKIISDHDINQAIHRVEASEGYVLEEEQTNTVAASLKSRIFVITGGPGRGKSTIIKTILEAWGDEDTVDLCAPTGKAAQRMKEITGCEAETVHKKIFLPPNRGHLIICDEASMLDIELGRDLLEWGRMCNIIFVGDVDQLPSVGPGSFFKNLVESRFVPTMKLIKGHRNFGSIAKNAERINEGQPVKKYTLDNAFKFLQADDASIQKVIIDEYLRMRTAFGEKSVCILAPMKDRTGSATNALNEAIRNMVNPLKPNSPRLEGCKFREGDRIMQTKNMASKEVIDPNGFPTTGVYNGDCGTIQNINEEENELTILFDDGRLAVYEKHETEELILSYAMTIHKSQGSEYKGVIVALTKGHNIMLRRRLLYTAVTRAKLEVACVGEEEAFNDAARNKIAQVLGDLYRNTKLLQRIEENLR